MQPLEKENEWKGRSQNNRDLTCGHFENKKIMTCAHIIFNTTIDKKGSYF